MEQTDKLLLLFLKFLFIIIILPKTIQMIIILCFTVAILFKLEGKIRIDKLALPFIILGFIHFISILVNCIGDFTLDRALAAFNTALLWILGGVVFSYSKNHSKNSEFVNKVMYQNMLILIFLAVLMLIIQKIGMSNITILSRQLIGKDWNNGVRTTRLMAFMEYSNLISMFYFLCFPFAYQHVIDNKGKFHQCIFFFLSILPVLMNRSRIGIILVIVNLLTLIPKIIALSKKKIVYISILLGFVLSIFVLINYNFLYYKLYSLINSRQGSTAMRSLIYSTSINRTLENSLIIGCGIKEYIKGYPLGSHSTFIGFFYKTGLVGLFFGVSGIITLYKRIFKTKRSYFMCMLCFLLMLFVEDLDGANWLIILFFVLMGLVLKNEKNVGAENEKNINYHTSL